MFQSTNQTMFPIDSDSPDGPYGFHDSHWEKVPKSDKSDKPEIRPPGTLLQTNRNVENPPEMI